MICMTYYIDEPIHVVIELENSRCRVLRMLKKLGIEEFKLLDIRGNMKGSTSHFIRIDTAGVKKLVNSKVIDGEKKKVLKGEFGVWIEGEGCGACKTILSEGAFLISGANSKGKYFIYKFIAPNYGVFQKILKSLENMGFKPKVLQVTKYRSRGKVLTEKQEVTLWIALRSGFFDYPRKIKVEDLAKRLNMSSSTLSEILRRGMRRLLEDYFKE